MGGAEAGSSEVKWEPWWRSPARGLGMKAEDQRRGKPPIFKNGNQKKTSPAENGG